MANYNFKLVEQKWQKIWEENGTFEAVDNSEKEKFYALVEFPYPSGAGMHVGHIKAYSGLEVVSRKRRLQGYNVLFPVGFDAYGLPTECPYSARELADIALNDKKRQGGSITLVMPYGIGDSRLYTVPVDSLEDVFKAGI